MESPQPFFHVEAEISRAWTLPAECYTSQAVFAAEKQRIFSRTWQVVGHAEQVRNSGDYFTTELMGNPC
jgi:phenylpropionate dioxygenase-like ring-hydroxylating dioxygenase large terminal subunit